jgi:hypothetical protein
MNWINIHTDVLRSESYLGAEPVERATWLNLIGWCCSQENGGSIKGAATWRDRKWQQLCGVTKEEVSTKGDLWEWSGDDLVVKFYPLEQEEKVSKNRESGKKGGRPVKKSAAKKPHGLHDQKPHGLHGHKPHGSEEEKPHGLEEEKPHGLEEEKPHGLDSLKRKGREGKEREREHGITPADSEPENVIISGEMPPVTLEAAKSKGEEMMVMPEVVEAWWLARDAVGWLRKEQPVRRWISDLKAYHAAWQRSGNTLPAAHNQPAKKQANRLATKDIPRIA